MNREFQNLSTDEKRSVIKRTNWNIKDWISEGKGMAVGVISDKQYVLFTDNLEKINTKEEVAFLMYDERNDDKEKYNENVFLEIEPSKIIMSYDKVLSNNQYVFINNILNEISDNNIIIEVTNGENTLEGTSDINKIKEFIEKDIQKDKITHDIYVFGNKLSNEEIIQNFKDKINKNFKNINEIINAVNKIEKVFFNDEFYFSIIRKVMPNFSEIFYEKDKLNKVANLLDNVSDEKYNIDIFETNKLLSLFKKEYNRFMSNMDDIFNMDMTMDQRVLILNKCIDNKNDIESIYPGIKDFIYFYYYYVKTFPEDLFNNTVDYETSFNIMINYVREDLQSKLAKKELKKHALEEDIKKKKIADNSGKFYKYTGEISDIQNKLNIIDTYKNFDISEIKRNYEIGRKEDKIEINKRQINFISEKIKLLEQQLNSYTRFSIIHKLFKKKNDKIEKDLTDLKQKKKELEEENQTMQGQIRFIEEERKNSKLERTRQIDELSNKIESIKNKFKNETTISFDEYEKKYRNYDNFDKDLNKKYNDVCEEIQNIKSKLRKIDELIEKRDNNNKTM